MLTDCESIDNSVKLEGGDEGATRLEYNYT